jgi:hypothetical protein
MFRSSADGFDGIVHSAASEAHATAGKSDKSSKPVARASRKNPKPTPKAAKTAGILEDEKIAVKDTNKVAVSRSVTRFCVSDFPPSEGTATSIWVSTPITTMAIDSANFRGIRQKAIAKSGKLTLSCIRSWPGKDGV